MKSKSGREERGDQERLKQKQTQTNKPRGHTEEPGESVAQMAGLYRKQKLGKGSAQREAGAV